MKIALDNLDAVIQTIRESASAERALVTLQERFTLSEIQARKRQPEYAPLSIRDEPVALIVGEVPE